MKARIIQTHSGGFYEGEVYGTWENILGTKWTGWEKVTGKCWTKLGARLELERWKKKHCPEVFEL